MAKSVVVIDQLRDPAWDAFVGGHERGWVSHLSSWRSMLEEAFPHLAGTCVTLQDEGRILAGLPLFDVKSRLTGRRMVGVPYATLFEPLCDEPGQVQTLIDAAVRMARERGAAHLEIRAIGRPLPVSAEGATVSLRNKTHTLDLDGGLEELQRRLHASSVRQVIARARRAGVRTRAAETEVDFEQFFRLYCQTRRRLGLPPQPRRFLHLIWRRLGPPGQFRISLADLGERTVAAIAVFCFGRRVSLEYSVTAAQFRNVGASQLLLWEAIGAAREGGYRIFDLGRTDERNQGLMRFKARWGAAIGDLPRHFIPAAGAVPREGVGGFPRSAVGRVLSRAPMPLLRAIGGFCYRHMS